MRVEFTNSGAELPDRNQTGRSTEAGTSGPEESSASTGRLPAAATSPASVTAPASSFDQARFSFDQSRVQSLASQVLEQPEVRQARVQSLQQSINNGEYSVPPGLLADAIANELGGAQG